ncbi:MAG: alpha/beta hydrolase-fold protein [Pirellulales bacterium]
MNTYTHDAKLTAEITLSAIIQRPPKFSESVSWPLLVILHGRGERAREDLIIENCFTKDMEIARQGQFVVAAPICPKESAWPQLARFLDRWLAVLLDDRELRIDATRVYLTGYSMGGFGTLVWAGSFPNRFAAIAPLCSGGGGYWLFDLDPHELSDAAKKWKQGSKHSNRLLDQLKSTPVHLYHGKHDSVHPFQDSVVVLDQLREVGCPVTLTEITADHKIWPIVYSDADFYDKLLAK